MTTATEAPALPLLQRLRATRALPPPAARRAIRDQAGLSREDIARELRARGFRVTEGAVKWWEKEKTEGGVDPRPATAIAYRQILERVQREVTSWKLPAGGDA